MVETENSQPTGSVTGDDALCRAYDSAGSDASTATDHVEVEPQRPVEILNDRMGVQNRMSNEEWEMMQQKLAVQALKMGDFKALARITSQMATHSKLQSNGAQRESSAMRQQEEAKSAAIDRQQSIEMKDSIISSEAKISSESPKTPDECLGPQKTDLRASGIQEEQHAEAGNSKTAPSQSNNASLLLHTLEQSSETREAAVLQNGNANATKHETQNADVKDDFEVVQITEHREAGDTATVMLSEADPLNMKEDTGERNAICENPDNATSDSLLTSPSTQNTDAIKADATLDGSDSLEIHNAQTLHLLVTPTSAGSEAFKGLEKENETELISKSSLANVVSLESPAATAALNSILEEGQQEDQLMKDETMPIVMPDKSMSESMVEKPERTDSGASMQELARTASEASNQNLFRTESNVSIEDLGRTSNAEDLRDDVLFSKAIGSSKKVLNQIQPTCSEGIPFTMLLLKTLEADAATTREQREFNSFSKELEVRDQVALMKWRSENYNEVSCLCLPLNNRLRARCCSLLEWKWFDRIIMLNIAINCVFMAMSDPNTKNEKNAYNTMLSNAGIFFQSVFTFEAVIKIISRGFIHGKKAYLRDGWNVLDFFTVVLGLLEYVVVTLGSSTSVLRTFRLLRPLRALRAVGRFRDLRMIVNLIISCLPLLVDVFALISFIFMVFGIIAVQLWGGYFRGRCYNIDDGLINKDLIDVVCSPINADGMAVCPASEMCLRIYMNPMYNALTYDYIGAVLVILFQIMIQQQWNNLMYYTWDCYSFWSWPFFVFLNLVGPMFAVQLFLVVVANQYSDAKALQREAEKAAVELFEVKVGAVTANLPRQSRSGHALSFDPYVQITVDEKMKKTRVIKNCSVPEWNEYFVFPVSSAASCAHVEVRNWKRQGNHDILGVLTIPVGVLDQSEEGTDRWYEICGAEGAFMEGSIRIRTQWRMISTDEWSPLPEVDDEDMPEEEDAEDEDLSFIGWLQLSLRDFAESRFLNIVSILFICGNTLGMASDHSCDVVEDMSCKTFKAQLEEANLAFTSFFALEMLAKVWGLGVLAYFKDISNFFDFSVTVISLVELPSSILQIKCYTSDHSSADTLEQCASAGGALSVLRSFRLVRILRLGKLLEFFPQIKRQLKVIRKTLGAVSSLVFLIIMYLVIFAILGMSVLGGSATEYLRTKDPDSLSDFRPGNSVRVLVPGDPYDSGPSDLNDPNSFFVSTATVVDFDGTKASRQYLVYHNSDTNHIWPLAGMTNETVVDWQMKHLYWLDAEETEPFQYANLARRKEVIIVGLVPRGHFDSFFNAIITVFQVFTTSDLGDVMYPSIRGTNMFAAVFFAIQILIGNLLLFNLFTGIIITGFSETKEELQREENENQKMIEQDRIRRAASLARGASVSSKGKQASVTRGMSIASSMAGSERCSALEAAYHRLKTKLFGSNRVTAEDLKKSAIVPTANNAQEVEESPRTLAYRIVSHRYFEGGVMFAIAISSAGLAMQRPGMTDTEQKIVQVIDTAVGGIFLTECILKIKGLGFFRYIGSRWNQLDFFLVITTMLDLIIEWFVRSSKIPIFSTLKVIRALRPLRVISRMKRLKDTFTTITRSFIPVMNTIAIAMCVFFIFAIMAVQLLGGNLNFCSDPFILNKAECHGVNPATNETRVWEPRDMQYDWIGTAVLSMFILASQDNWETGMFAGLDATSSTTGPYINNRPIIALFFLSYMIVGSFFVVQLFVGVFIDTFQTVIAERKAMSRQSSIASETTDASTVQNVREPASEWRFVVYEVVTQKAFDILIAIYIILNILLMASEAYKQSSVQDQIITQGNFIFTFVFGTEMIVKLFAFRAKNYISSGWNQFDFFVVSISYIGIALDLLGSVVVMDSSIVRIFRVFRIFRILRAFRIFRAAQRLQNLIRTLVRSLKEVANLGILLLLLFFVTAVMVVEIFGRMCASDFNVTPVPGKFDRCILIDERHLLDVHATFINVGVSLLTLFRICTGDNWSDIMEACSLSPGPRLSKNATQVALQYLIQFNMSSGENLALLSAARKALPVCQTREELDALDSIIFCEEKDSTGFCATTCGDFNLASIIFTIFLFGSQFVLLNLVMAVLMRELSSAISHSARKQDNQTSNSISVLLTVNQATNTWLRRASLNDKDDPNAADAAQLNAAQKAASTDSGSEKHVS